MNYTKKIHMDRKGHSNVWIRRFFIFLGNKYHVFETKINRKFLNISSDFAFRIKPLSDEDAITKGVEFFYEVILYVILITIPLYEMNRNQNEAKEKSKIISDKLQSLEDGIEKIKNEIKDESDNLGQKLSNFNVFVKNFEKSIEIAYEQSEKDSQDLRSEINKMIEQTSSFAKELSNDRNELMKKAKELMEQQNGILSLLTKKKSQAQ